MSAEAQTFPARNKDAALRLRLWMTEHDASPKRLADALKCSVSQVSRWLQRVAKPSRAHANKIEKITGGAVSAHSWDES
jgi:transcriptional regulator with XRE-family HTH domain